MRLRPALLLAVLAAVPTIAQAQYGKAPSKVRRGESQKSYYRAGVTISAPQGPCRGLKGTLPVPTEWPEQDVQIIEEQITPGTQVTYRTLDQGVKQMVVAVPALPAGQQIDVLVTYELTTYKSLPPDDVSKLKVDSRPQGDIRFCLNPSPGIESRSAKFSKLAREITHDKPNAWEEVHAIYDWTRNTLERRAGPFQGSLEAVKNGGGDVEDMTAVFIALCRAKRIPARTVWVPQHCYAEFYLVDGEGEGTWFPCDLTVEGDFGKLSTAWPILQKGDNIRVPENPRSQERYVPELLTGKGGKPRVKFVRETVDPEAVKQPAP